MKKCSKCRIKKDFSRFLKHPRTSGGFRGVCKDCQNAQCRERYANNPALRLKHWDKARRWELANPEKVRAARFKRREWYRKYKSETPCADCGGCFPAECMDFDHVGVKTNYVSQLVMGGYSVEVIRKEMTQCDLVCANCHRIRTCARKAARRIR